MSADVVIGGMLVMLAVSWCITWLLVCAAGRKAPTPPPIARKFYTCQHRGCTARATRIVLVVSGIGPTESRVVCDSDRDRLTITGAGVDLGPIFRGRA